MRWWWCWCDDALERRDGASFCRKRLYTFIWYEWVRKKCARFRTHHTASCSKYSRETPETVVPSLTPRAPLQPHIHIQKSIHPSGMPCDGLLLFFCVANNIDISGGVYTQRVRYIYIEYERNRWNASANRRWANFTPSMHDIVPGAKRNHSIETTHTQKKMLVWCKHNVTSINMDSASGFNWDSDLFFLVCMCLIENKRKKGLWLCYKTKVFIWKWCSFFG